MKTKHIAAAVLALAMGAAQAAPFAITYQGTIADSDIPGVHNGQRYTLTLVMDNGGSDADNETWEPRDLTCAIWRVNDAANVVVAHDLRAAPPAGSGGAVETNGSADLMEVFTHLESGYGMPGAALRTRGLPPGAPLSSWYANDSNRVFYVDGGQGNEFAFGDSTGGVPMNTQAWSEPAPFTGNCLDAAGPAGAGGGVAPVPTLGHAALALLGALVGGAGLRGGRHRNESIHPQKRTLRP
ncbi:IPTL-CTERM sorting domain-containing protein [Acidovorax sp. SDU_ACID1]|uniref:IPTL-CTERM sorting domain-containing protein n=1 Tax=Acidovorax sp. SDU_ACID1 TaxID=3136632 RepID=UPI003872F360